MYKSCSFSDFPFMFQLRCGTVANWNFHLSDIILKIIRIIFLNDHNLQLSSIFDCCIHNNTNVNNQLQQKTLPT